jgi:anaerobic magnesium-protoporphyrin IX monomethyl ester cyclase
MNHSAKPRIALLHVKVVDASDPPLGLMYIGACLMQDGFVVRLWDEYKNTQFVDDVVSFAPDIVGISVLSSQVELVKSVIRKLRQKISPLIILGGIHPTILPEQTLRETQADAVVIGEGERTMQEFVQKWDSRSWEAIKGLAYLNSGQYVQNPPRELIADLDELPFPDYDLLDLKKVFIPPGTVRGHFLRATAHISTSRGCPNRCIYCNCPTIFGTKVRKRSVPNVIAEIKKLVQKYPVIEGMWFVDDSFTTYPSWVIEFCDAMIREKLNSLIWSCQTRVSHINQDMLIKMKAAGCVQVEYGIESGCNRVLKVLQKNTNTDMVREAVYAAKRAGLNVLGTFMIGSPTETISEMEQTFRFAKELPLDCCRFFFTTPFPGTKLYDMAQQNHWLNPDYAFSEVLSLRQTNPGETTDEPLMVCEVPAKTLIRLRAKYQNYFVWRNYRIYLRQWRHILEMVFALVSRPRLLFHATYFTIKSRRFDTFIESLILAWRMNKLK